MSEKKIAETTKEPKDIHEGLMSSPCTIAEAVQIATGVAEDVLASYQHRMQHLQLAISIQIEILKGLAIKSGVVSEEQFREMYLQKIQEFNEMQEKALNRTHSSENSEPKLDMVVSDIEVKKE